MMQINPNVFHSDLREEGRMIGREEGRTIGRQEGEYELNRLYAALVSQKRFDDLEKATSDETFRQELYHEMQLA